MANQGKSTVVPKLRFPEFRESAGWEMTPLSKAFPRITNGKANSQDHEEGGIYPLFDRSEVIKASSNFAFAAEAVILPGEGMSFRPRYFDGKFNLHQRAYALMDCQGHTKYFYYALDHAKDELALKAVKSTVLSLRLPIIEKFVVYAPERQEQQKIADCLTSLDEVIAAQRQKVEALKAHKRGLMQQLFPREGETRPRLRFPEFHNALEWQEQTLGKIANVKASGDLDSSLFSETRSESFPHPVYSNAVERNGLFGYYSVPQYPRDSITITARGTLGIAFFRDHEFMGIGRLLVVSDLKDVNPRFLTECWNHLAVISNEVTSIPQLTAVTARMTRLPIPSIEEQSRIADCLSSLDTQITAESNQLTALKTHKQGLMQQLFPAPEQTS